MNPTEAAAHAELQTALIYGSIVVLLILGGFIWWLNYTYKQRNKGIAPPIWNWSSRLQRCAGGAVTKNMGSKRGNQLQSRAVSNEREGERPP